GLEARPILTWLDVMRASIEALEDGVLAIIYLAEINELCDARDWQYTPRWWTKFVQERRHMGVGLIGDTQHISQVEKRLRLLIGRVVQVEPGWLRRHWKRWPVFLARDVGTLPGDDPAAIQTLSKARRVWQYSHAFHGHATWELVANEDFRDLESPEAQAEIESLRIRAIELNKVTRLPAMPDSLFEPPVAENDLTEALLSRETEGAKVEGW
ncbi:MAG: hypothetical protein Q8N51_17615, partial [Gammaproteobacteria bacterium]|nr:hypothetical protein [Gammaproteobacteria bacterium]